MPLGQLPALLHHDPGVQKLHKAQNTTDVNETLYTATGLLVTTMCPEQVGTYNAKLLVVRGLFMTEAPDSS